MRYGKTTLVYNEPITLKGIPLELFMRVITVSRETQKTVQGLPALEILPSNPESGK